MFKMGPYLPGTTTSRVSGTEPETFH